MLAAAIRYPENPSIPDKSGFPLRYNLRILILTMKFHRSNR